jgi:hypothetical protein
VIHSNLYALRVCNFRPPVFDDDMSPSGSPVLCRDVSRELFPGMIRDVLTPIRVYDAQRTPSMWRV